MGTPLRGFRWQGGGHRRAPAQGARLHRGTEDRGRIYKAEWAGDRAEGQPSAEGVSRTPPRAAGGPLQDGPPRRPPERKTVGAHARAGAQEKPWVGGGHVHDAAGTTQDARDGLPRALGLWDAPCCPLGRPVSRGSRACPCAGPAWQSCPCSAPGQPGVTGRGCLLPPGWGAIRRGPGAHCRAQRPKQTRAPPRSTFLSSLTWVQPPRCTDRGRGRARPIVPPARPAAAPAQPVGAPRPRGACALPAAEMWGRGGAGRGELTDRQQTGGGWGGSSQPAGED